ncbi:MAG: undecaprenyl/decaprenyl-phosphate alpha-N-acetylglucosaminyl 1-phosphate transferase [Anaerolineae bacterium]|nr:undecaprenyl/decaprenyl-phosphate alpha-N-acetylglucosaminyl 1-phosphate transferase [Anaerolineae bacterium]
MPFSEHLGAFLAVFAIAFVLAMVLVPVAQRLATRWQIVDRPRGRHQHTRPTAKLGGLALYVAFTVAVLVAQVLPVPRFDPWEWIRLAGLLLGGTFVFIFGLLDDRFEFGPLPQAIAQITAAGIAIFFRIFIETFNNPLTGEQTDPWPYIVTVTISLLWLGVMMNTVNWLDGVDGLAGGVAFIAAAVLFVNAVFRLDPPQISVSLLPVALMGATAGFLLFNFPPAKIFMGSNGAFFLGYTVGALSIIGGAKAATILLVMGLPLLDLVWQIVHRVIRGRNPMQGDRGHLHFRLTDLGMDKRVMVLGYYAFCAFFGGLALFTTSRLFKFVALIVMGVIVLVGFLLLMRLSTQRAAITLPEGDDDHTSSNGT